MNAISYALDIGVYFTGQSGEVLAKTTAAWCRVANGVNDFHELAYLNSGGGCDEACLSGPGGKPSFLCGRSLPVLATALARDLVAGHRVGLGFEAPMWIPPARKHGPNLSLFEPRFPAEEDHRWYLQSGAAASLKAMVLGGLLFELLESQLGSEMNLTSSSLHQEGNSLILYEAFVAGEHKMPIPSAVEIASDEWDAFVAALAWGSLHAGFDLPKGFEAAELHKAGSAEGRARSVWGMIRRDGTVAGPPDCQVVALAQKGGT